ncbi:Ankyrin repeat-containing protein 18 [Elsinoe fawcettii]|nr:Ankyrin repeat-containing protein 18 [Elsinoe fawcettii]
MFKEAPADTVDEMGRSPLHLAFDEARSRSDYDGFILKLLDAGAEPNRRDGQGRNALHLAFQVLRSTKTRLVDALIAKGVDVHARDVAHNTPLLHAEICPSIAKRMMAAGADMNARNLDGETWFYKNIHRMKNSDIWNVRKCLDLGVELRTVNKRGRSMLFSLCRSGIEEGDLLWDLMLENGLEPKLSDVEGNTLMHEIMTVPDQHKHQTISWISRLSKLGLSIDKQNHKGQTPLHILCSMGHMGGTFDQTGRWMPFVQHMVKLVGNKDARDVDGVTPLMLACNHSEHLVQYLLQQGADALVRTRERLTCLHIAARARQPNIVGLVISYLRKHGGVHEMSELMNAKDADGWTPLHHACRSGLPQSVSILLEASQSWSCETEYSSYLRACAEAEGEDKLWRDYVEISQHEASGMCHGKEVHLLGQLPVGVTCTLAERTRPFTEIGRQLVRTHRSLRANSNPFGKDGDIGSSVRAIVHSMETRRSQRLHRGPDQSHGGNAQGTTTSCTGTVSVVLRSQDSNTTKQAKDPNALLEGYGDEMLIHDLVKDGNVRVLRDLGLSLAAPRADSDLWRHTKDKTLPGFGRCIEDPGWKGPGLLQIACERILPNMAVVRVLVEELGVNGREIRKGPYDFWDTEDVESACQDCYLLPGERQVDRTPTILHHLAQGRHWWHVYQTLPYLLETTEVDLEYEDEYQQTPLRAALTVGGLHSAEAARLLIKHGANVNVVDCDGDTCLDICTSNEELRRVLISRGALSRTSL